MPATGFAVDIDALSECVKTPDDMPLKEIIWYENGNLKDALSYIDRRPCGSAVLSCAPCREEAEKDAQEKGVRLTVIGNGGAID